MKVSINLGSIRICWLKSKSGHEQQEVWKLLTTDFCLWFISCYLWLDKQFVISGSKASGCLVSSSGPRWSHSTFHQSSPKRPKWKWGISEDISHSSFLSYAKPEAQLHCEQVREHQVQARAKAGNFGVEHVTFHASIPLKMTTTMVLTIPSDHRFKHQMLQWHRPSLLFAIP